MAAKHKPKAGKTPIAVGVPLRQEVDRLIAKGRFKDAVKQAKLCFRQEGTPEHHRLLERTYFLRAQQLQQGGMPTAAQEVALHLLDFGITDPALTEPTAALLLSVGLAGRSLELQDRLEEPEARERLARQTADQEVLHPERSTTSPPEVRAGASRVRAALAALETGDGAKALAELGDVSRNSPFAEWKLFVRGLAAYQGRDADSARSNWERLDPERAPARIARALLTVAGPEIGEGTAGQASALNLEWLERRAFGEPILAPLQELAALVAQDRWVEAIRMLGPLRFALRRIDPALAVRLTQVLYSRLIDEATRHGYREGKKLVEAFAKIAEPLPIDPRWNRLWALVWEGPQGHIDEAEVFWRKYLEDLKSTPALQPEERPKAQALVWLHLGEEIALLAADYSRSGPVPRKIDAHALEARGRVVDCLQESLRLCPTLREAHEALMDAYEDWDRPDDAAEAARRRLQVLPDDFDASAYLSEHHFRRDEFAQALDYAQRARKLRPLDKDSVQNEWDARVALARDHALHGRWDEGRAEFEAAEGLHRVRSCGFSFLARRAALELKAGQAERAEAFLKEAQGLLVEPAPLWLAMLIEAGRFKLSQADRERFHADWVVALSKRCRGETAGAFAKLLGPFLADNVAFPGRDEHVRQVVDYLQRSMRTKYRCEDLIQVCSFLGLAAGGRDLFEKLAHRGLKLFPDALQFPVMLGSVAMEKGPRGANLTLARRHFQKALELAQAQQASEPKVAAMIPQIRKTLATLEELIPGPLGFLFNPFGSFGRPDALPPGLFEMLEDEGYDLDELLGLEDDEDDPPAPATRPRRKKRKV